MSKPILSIDQLTTLLTSVSAATATVDSIESRLKIVRTELTAQSVRLNDIINAFNKAANRSKKRVVCKANTDTNAGSSDF